jgi:hypothetical protein
LRLGLNGERLGAVSTPTCETSTRSSRIHNALLALSVCILAFAALLLSPALALAGNGNGSGNAAPTSTTSDPVATTTTNSGDPTTTTSAHNASPAPSAPVTPDAAAPTTTSAADTAGAQNNGNGNGAQNNGNGNGNGNGNAAAPAVTPTPDPAPPVTTAANAQNNGNSDNSPNGNATGQTSSPGNSANAPGNGDPPGNSDHAGNANASANANQDKPKNVNVDVRVGNPGNNGAVVQGNGAAAAAGAGSTGGSGSGSGSAPTALAPGGAATDANAAPGSAAPAPSQADSTSGETIPNANSPPGGTTGSESCADGLGSTATTASPDGQSPTDSNTSPSASYVNGQCGNTQTGGNSGTSTAGNTDSDLQATGVTGESDSEDPQATGVTVEIDPGTDDGSGGTTVVDTNPDDTADDASPMPTVIITAPTPTSSSSQDSATATATSTQVDPANINTTVRVLSSGENGPIHQTNTSTATAAAGATGPVTGTQVATPTATSTQVTPANVNVSIRVGSPGNDAPVTQGNTSTAVAAPVDPSLIDAAVTDLPANGPNSSGDVENASSVIQDLAQCSADETDCISSSSGSPQGITGPGGSAADNSIASAAQDSPSNVNVSIRVASPGADGLLTQLNDASATGLTSVETVTNPDNHGVAIVVPGLPEDVVIPTGSDTPWNWNWNWNWTTGSAPTDPGATPTSTSEWAWNWTPPAEGSPAATSAPQGTPGMWTWTWTWTRGEWSVSWSYQQACDCSWTWNWTWVWPADSPSAPTSPASALLPPPPANPQISQTNDSTAAAAAVTTFDGSQEMTISSDGESDATQYQGITSIQSATASADAGQVDPRNTIIRTAGAIEGIKQLNRVAAASTAAAFDTATQTLEQTQTGTDDGAVHSVASTQVIGTLQTATSDAVATQAHALNLAHVWSQASGNQAWIQKITQTNESVALGFAAVESVASQSLNQTQTGAGSDQLADALQEAVTTQQNVAAAHVGQASVRNRIEMEIPWNGAMNPPIDQSNGVSAASISESYSEITQTAVQEASGEGVEWDQHAQQVAIVNQGGTASSSASQSNIDNLAHWTGTLATPPPGTVRGGGASTFGQAADAPVADSLIFGDSPPPLSGVLAGSVELSRLAAARILTAPHGSRGFDSTGAAPGPRAATASAPMTPSERFVHTLFNLLGAGSSALVLLLGTTPFAALLALFMIAALGVGRLQYAMPALGRSVDFARRERPG